MSRRIFALIFAVLTVIMSVPFTVSAASTENFEYSDCVDWNKFRGKNVTINVYNWGEYIAVEEEEGDFDTIAEFEELTGINVNYSNFASNEEMYAKLRSGGASYDIVIPSDYMVARMINENMVEKLNMDNIPNFQKLMPRFQTSSYDPGSEYSIPYMWGIVGIIYNTTLVDEEDDVGSWDILWNEKYANNILMFSNSRDATGIAMFKLGYSVNSTDEEQWRECFDELSRQKPLVQAYVMDEIFDKMGGGEAALAPYYAGDAVTMIDDNPDLAFSLPREGSNIFNDAMCIPKGSKNKEAAEMFINFMCETQTALANCEYIGYGTPQAEAYELLDDEVKNGISYPPDEALETLEVFDALPTATTKLIDQLWTELMSESGISPWVTPVFMVASIALIIFINLRRHAKKKAEGR